MISSIFIKELKRYSKSDLVGMLKCSENEAVSLIRRLKEFGLMYALKDSDLQKEQFELLDTDIEMGDPDESSSNRLYVIDYVGVIVVSGVVLKCYPKYFLTEEQINQKLRKVIKVIDKYKRYNSQLIRVFGGGADDSKSDALSVILYLIKDFYDNGSYLKQDLLIENNGSGEINWDKTVCLSDPIISNGRPFYYNLYTTRRVNDFSDYFARLHRCILTLATQELKKTGLLDIFGITEIDLSEEELADFGGDEEIVRRINAELNMEFNTRKQLVLQAMRSYIEHGSIVDGYDGISLYGTKNFKFVWQEVCSSVLDNKLYSKLDSLCLPKPLLPKYNSNWALIDLIEKPFWSITNKHADYTFKPDLIAISGESFILYDAKYYVPRLLPGSAPKGQPGIESVAKQYLYHLAFKNFINDHGFKLVRNCFLMPTDKDNVVDSGEVSMNMLSSLGLENIKIKLLPADKTYDYYLSDTKIEWSNLEP